jgi:hypothetical protein
MVDTSVYQNKSAGFSRLLERASIHGVSSGTVMNTPKVDGLMDVGIP